MSHSQGAETDGDGGRDSRGGVASCESLLLCTCNCNCFSFLFCFV